MKTTRLRIFAVLLSFFVFGGSADAESSKSTQMGMVTGGPTGTYYQFGLNLERLVVEHGISLNVANSDGSVENVYAVYKRPNTQMGIVQSDVLAFVAKVQSDPVLKRIAQKIKMIYPLYNEEIHLLGRGDIAEFDGLQGKRVAIGQEGSGTYLTAKLLFEVSGIVPGEMLAISADDAINMLKSGEIDAMFYVAGFPVKLFAEQVTPEDGLVLVPILNKSIVEFYPNTEIPAGTYSWQSENVSTVAVKAVLVSYNFRNANCKNVGRFANILANNIDWLRAEGHPKWNSVDLDYPLKGWEQYDCVKQYAIDPKPKTVVPKNNVNNPVLNAIKEML